jgi:hypothetical protein
MGEMNAIRVTEGPGGPTVQSAEVSNMTFRTVSSLSCGLAGGAFAFALAALAACTDSTSAAPGPDASIPVDAGGANDGATADACVTGLPPAGLFQLAAGEKIGRHTSLVLDEQGNPIVAYQKDDGTGSATSITIEMRRWDASCSTWGPAMTVDTVGAMTDNGRQIKLAYDASNGTVGVIYQAIVGKFGDNDHYEIRLAELKKGATSVSPPQRVDDGSDDANHPTPESPGLGMANGKVFAAWEEAFRLCNVTKCGALVYRSRDTNGTWSAESNLPGNGPSGYGDARGEQTSIAVDSAGNPAVAWISTIGVEGTGGVKMRATFIRPGASAPTLIMENTDTTGTDDPWVEIAFDGTKPRALVILNRDANYTQDRKQAWFVASDNGDTWSAPVALPNDNGSTLDRFGTIAVGGGKVVLAVDSNSADGTQAFGNPKILTSTDLTTFTVSGIAKDTYDGTAEYVSAALDPAGKLQLVMKGSPQTDPAKVGALYYRQE